MSLQFSLPIVYGFFISFNDMAIMSFMKAAGIRHEYYALKPMEREHKEDWYLRMNPEGLFPTMTEGHFVATETVAILQYLCETKQIEDHWYPKDARKRAKIDQFLSWFYLSYRVNH
jgi:glutathione S-transferase